MITKCKLCNVNVSAGNFCWWNLILKSFPAMILLWWYSKTYSVYFLTSLSLCLLRWAIVTCAWLCHTLPYSTVPYSYSTLFYSTLLYSTLLYSTPYSTLLCSTLLYSTLLYSTLPYPTLLYSTLLYSTLLHSTPLHSTPLHSTPPHPTPPHSTLLYSTLLYHILGERNGSYKMCSQLFNVLYLPLSADKTRRDGEPEGRWAVYDDLPLTVPQR